jgi:ribose 5-phosphate isomerase B
MKIYLASDHAGCELKERVKEALAKEGHELTDFGAATYNPDDDYPDFVWRAAENISHDYMHGDTDSRAIIFGGSGEGEAMLANRFADVRAAAYYGGNTEILRLSREHNDANTLSIGARFVSEKEALEAIQLWLATDFSNEERHKRRLAKLEDLSVGK